MEQKIFGKRFKMRTRKNAKLVIDYSDSDDSDVETFINIDAHQHFTNHFSRMSIHSDRGFVYNMEEDNLGLPEDIEWIIMTIKWIKFLKNPNPYNIQKVKEFYSNIVHTQNRWMKVVVKGTNVVYFEATISMVLSLHNVGDTYIHLLENSDDVDLDVLKDSLCKSSTRWIDADKSSEKTVRSMDFHPC